MLGELYETCTWPPIASVSACAPPRVRDVSHAHAGQHVEDLPAMREPEALPDDAKLICPGRVFANAMNSFSVFAGTEG